MVVGISRHKNVAAYFGAFQARYHTEFKFAPSQKCIPIPFLKFLGKFDHQAIIFLER